MTSDNDDLGIVDGLVQLSFVVQSVLAAAAARHDLTVAQVRLMGILRDREPGMRQLAEHLGLDKSSVTGLVARAEARGLVQRWASEDDGRAVHVSATRRGRRLTGRVEAEIVASMDDLVSDLSPTDRTRLARLTSHVVAHKG